MACKRLRHATGFFEPLALGRTDDALEALTAVRDILGRINDDATAWKLLDALAVEQASPEFQQICARLDGAGCRRVPGVAPGCLEALQETGRWWK